MRRKEAIIAHREGRKPRQLLETDYLLGVHDEARMGALRFALKEGGPFLSCDSDMAAPPWVTLRNLEAASLAFEQDEDTLNDRVATAVARTRFILGRSAAKSHRQGCQWRSMDRQVSIPP